MAFNYDIPKIVVENNSNVQAVAPNGIAGRLGVIADLGIASTDLIVANNYREFLEKVPATALTNPTADLKAIKQLFLQKEDSLGASSIIVAPVGSNYTVTTFGDALDKLEAEEFDILIILKPVKYETATIGGVSVADAYLTMLKNWLKTRYTNKDGVGSIFALRESTESNQDIITRMTDFGRGCYACICQEVNGLTLNETVGFITGTIAGRRLDKSLTAKVVAGMTSITDENGANKELLINDGSSIGKQYMNAGIMVFRPFNRRNNDYGVLRSICPSGFDMSVERRADYMTREFQLKDYLGESNNVITLDSIAGEINAKKHQFVEILGLCNEINTNIQKVNSHTVEVDIEYVFDGIIDLIKVFVEFKIDEGE